MRQLLIVGFVLATSLMGTELTHAILQKDVAKVKELIARGVDLEEENTSRRSPLHEAANVGSVAIAKLLLDAGANPNVTSTQGFTPLKLAVMGSYVDGKQVGPHIGLMKLFLSYGADPSIVQGNVGTSLHTVAANAFRYDEFLEAVELLMFGGADPYVTVAHPRNPNGWSSFHWLAKEAGSACLSAIPWRAERVFCDRKELRANLWKAINRYDQVAALMQTPGLSPEQAISARDPEAFRKAIECCRLPVRREDELVKKIAQLGGAGVECSIEMADTLLAGSTTNRSYHLYKPAQEAYRHVLVSGESREEMIERIWELRRVHEPLYHILKGGNR